MSKLCFCTKLRSPSRPSPFNKTPNKKQQQKLFLASLTSMDTIRCLGITVTRVINVFLSQKKGSCHAPQDEQWSHKLQFCIASSISNSQRQRGGGGLPLLCSAALSLRSGWLNYIYYGSVKWTAWSPRTGNTYDPDEVFSIHCRPSNVTFFFFCLFLFFLFLFCFFLFVFCCTKFKVALSGKQWLLADKTSP